MQKQMFTFSIDVAKIDKSRIKEVVKKDGTTAKFLNLVMFVNPDADQYGYHGFIVESVTKEEKEKGIKGVILGNAKRYGDAPIERANVEVIAQPKVEDDLPF